MVIGFSMMLHLRRSRWRVSTLTALLLICVRLPAVQSDTPANCTYDDVEGSWSFFIGSRGGDRTMDCTSVEKVGIAIKVKLSYPDIAVDEFGNKGFWTMVYNQGFEVVIHGRKYFGFSAYEGTEANATSFCDRTKPGWCHDVMGHHWHCFYATKSTQLSPKPTKPHSLRLTPHHLLQKLYKPNKVYISHLNKVQNSWKAVHYTEYESLTLGDILSRSGGRKSAFTSPNPVNPSSDVKAAAVELPADWDWTNIDGKSFVSPVRNQGSCGSCYAFATMGMFEARQLVMTQGSFNATFAPQDIVECSKYSQGCDGGFPYLVSKYAEDYGIVDESCDPYKGEDGPCSTKPSCYRHYATRYRYVGGYYGGCSPEAMQLALYKNGPLAVSFEVYDDFMHYQGGVYQHTGIQDKFNPFEITNHAVLLVGWGTDTESGLNYWKVKNSWGVSWGERGFFRIKRGVDECSIESIAVESFMIF